MENKLLIDLSVKYGLNSSEISKLVSIIYQAGVHDMNSKDFAKIARFICENSMVNIPAEELIEELKRKGYIKA